MSQPISLQLPGGWEAVAVLGSGSFGTVYKARRVIGSNVEWAAVKRISLPPEGQSMAQVYAEIGTQDPSAADAYFRSMMEDISGEYFQMKSLQGYTNIVSCQDLQRHRKPGGGYDVFIWMELLDSLSERMAGGSMSQAEVIRMGRDMCQALSILRSKGIVPATDGGWIHFDYVPGESDVRRGGAQVTGRICVIGSKLNEDALKELFCLG